ncbi:hypothetical protein AB0G74_07940 [Streptomyces sp. NPDC020875]|uniref:hypothetical protein n=1 Tax=Streptomyces sp. NPDC020875 TaxID=3154898 RepID=UPI0034100360
MTASAAQLLLSALTDLSVPTRDDAGGTAGPGPGPAGPVPGEDTVPGPLTSEPPLFSAAPLTSEPPLVELPPLTSEPTTLGAAGGGPSTGG